MVIKMFLIGDEILFNGKRHVISEYSEDSGYYRLLSVGEKGTKFNWAKKDEIKQISKYVKTIDDTRRY